MALRAADRLAVLAVVSAVNDKRDAGDELIGFFVFVLLVLVAFYAAMLWSVEVREKPPQQEIEAKLP